MKRWVALAPAYPPLSGEPSLFTAAARAVAIARPSPRLAPTTIVGLPDWSLMIILLVHHGLIRTLACVLSGIDPAGTHNPTVPSHERAVGTGNARLRFELLRKSEV